MKTITTDVYEEEDINALIDARMQPVVDWTVQMTNSFNELSSIVAEIQELNTLQNKRINALKNRVTLLEEQIASGVYNDTY